LLTQEQATDKADTFQLDGGMRTWPVKVTQKTSEIPFILPDTGPTWVLLWKSWIFKINLLELLQIRLQKAQKYDSKTNTSGCTIKII
jgi:hypothetical protein